MSFVHFEYSKVLVFLCFALFLSLLILSLSVLFSKQAADSEKLSAYECGFDPFEDARNQFDVRFYLVAILFIIFDLEASFVFPWAVSLGLLDQSDMIFAFWSITDFIFELIIGFIYAWNVGSLEWLLIFV